jgi:hypothetical protein
LLPLRTMETGTAPSDTIERSCDRHEPVTAVVTSCGRHDLLKHALDSFFSFNTYPTAQTLVVEDGPEIPAAFRRQYVGRSIEWLATGTRVGQIAAIDHAYSRIETDYIFHLEDDWEFYRPGFIERSLVLLRRDPSCLVVWIRSTRDTVGHPVERATCRTDGVVWRRMVLDYDMNGVLWHGFTFNPGLRRLAEYIGGYGIHARFDFQTPWSAENAIAKIYRSRGFYAAILADEDGAGYVRHLGRGRRVPPPQAGERATELRNP